MKRRDQSRCANVRNGIDASVLTLNSVRPGAVGGDLGFAGGRFSNPNNVALDISIARIGGSLVLAWAPFGPFEADGQVNMGGTHVGGLFLANRAKFGGKATERHRLFAGVRPPKSRPLLFSREDVANY